MSNLVYQTYNNKCKGWVNPSNISYGPQITGLSSYQSPAGFNTIVAIYGSNFFSYSTVRFGTFTPTVYFVNSNILQFYIPNTLNSGTFTIQICNGSFCSNIINYTIDNASGYWLLNGENITNTNNNNNGGVNISWLSRGAPKIIDNVNNYNNIGEPYKVPDNVNWIITTNTSSNYSFYIELPTGTNYIGREISIKNLHTQNCLSTSSNIIALDSNPNDGTSSDIIVIASKEKKTYWSTLVNLDGLLWIIMTANWDLT